MTFPRMVALAERAWHKASWENVSDVTTMEALRQQDWEGFTNTLGFHELPRLDKMDINYHIRPAGVRQGFYCKRFS